MQNLVLFSRKDQTRGREAANVLFLLFVLRPTPRLIRNSGYKISNLDLNPQVPPNISGPVFCLCWSCFLPIGETTHSRPLHRWYDYPLRPIPLQSSRRYRSSVAEWWGFVNVAMSFPLQAHCGQTSNIVPRTGRDWGWIFTALVDDIKL